MKTLAIAFLLLSATIGLSFAGNEDNRINLKSLKELMSRLALAEQQGLFDILDDNASEQGPYLGDENADVQEVFLQNLIEKLLEGKDQAFGNAGLG